MLKIIPTCRQAYSQDRGDDKKMMRWAVFVADVLLLVFLFSLSAFSSADYISRPGSVKYTLSVPDSTQVTLDAVSVQCIISPWILVKDPWNSEDILPIYAKADVPQWSSIEITGYTRTIQGHRIVVATHIRLYTGANGKPFYFMPKSLREPTEWEYMVDVPLETSSNIRGASSMSAMSAIDIPIPPDPTVNEEPSPETVLIPGTIAWAKNQTTTVTLSSKVVTAVFYTPNTRTVTSFYVQEPTVGGNGIKVVPQVSVPVEPGNLVTISGSIIPSGTTQAECYIDAANIQCTGSMVVPVPVGTTGRTTAGGVFYSQQALYQRTSDPSLPRDSISGAGLSLVGTRMRTWGSVTWVSSDGTNCFVDDGSGLKSNFSGSERTGIRLIYPSDQPAAYQAGNYIQGITGILGAEFSEDTVPQPVPVVRIPRKISTGSHIIRVKSSGGSDSNNGTNWTTDAMATVQGAITKAITGDEIWVAGQFIGASAHITSMKDGISIYGGFAGIESEIKREQRNWIQNITILDGGASGSVINIPSGVTSSARIDGFTICNGKLSSYGYGAGINCVGASPIIVNNIISSNNTASGGGGISCDTNSSPIIWGNNITGNIASYGNGIRCNNSSPIIYNNIIYANNHSGSIGGGIYCYNSSPLISYNTIASNEVYSPSSYSTYGGGIYCNGGSPQVHDNIISDNVAYKGGGIYSSNSSPVILRNTITKNSASSYGGGIYCNDGQTQVSWNTISYNTSPKGAGIYIDSAPCSIINCKIFNNTATTTNGFYPGGGGGIYCSYSSPSIINSVLMENTGNEGGAIYLVSSSPNIMNCTITQNVDAPISGFLINNGGAVWCNNSSFSISNSIIALNSSGLYMTGTGTVSFDSNDIYQNTRYQVSGLTDPTGTNGNISVDPEFEIDEFHIDRNSLCAGAGDNSAVIGQFDIDGDSRIMPVNGLVDMGADETSNCGWHLKLIATDHLVGAGSIAHMTFILVDDDGNGVPYQRVDFIITEGVGILDTSCSNTGADGTIQISITSSTIGWVKVKATVTDQCEKSLDTTGQVQFYDLTPRYVGFLYDLCLSDTNINQTIDAYLSRISTVYTNITYQKITGTPFTINNSFNTIFLVLPTRDLQQSELQALSTFIQSGRDKRLVLVGEYSQNYRLYNNYLNTINQALGINSLFNVGNEGYDSGADRNRLCVVNQDHYLTSGVSYLWDAASDTFQSSWSSYARPLAYLNEYPSLPWIVEEDTVNAGSRVLIHDACIFLPAYDDNYDIIPDKNFAFIHNLCVIFPQ